MSKASSLDIRHSLLYIRHFFQVSEVFLMTFLQAIVIGIIQGLTEFIPISSTAHIKVIPKLLDWEDPGAAFTAVIQWGTLVAAMIYFRQDIIRLTRAMLAGISTQRWVATLDAKMSWMIVVGTIPVVVFGVLLHKYIEGPFRSLYVIAASAIVLALALAAAEGVARWRLRADLKLKGMDDLSWWDAVAVGFAQAVAIIPGASRSGVTITGGLFVGMKRETAARFSFLLSLPAVFGAGLFELYKRRHELLKSQEHIWNLVIATIVSGIVGYATIAFLLGYLKKHTTYLFIIYRLVVGGVILVFLFQGKLEPLPPEKAPGPNEQGTVAVPSPGFVGP